MRQSCTRVERNTFFITENNSLMIVLEVSTGKCQCKGVCSQEHVEYDLVYVADRAAIYQ